MPPHARRLAHLKLHWDRSPCALDPSGSGPMYPIIWASQVVLVVKNPPADARDIRDAGSIPGLRRSPRGGNDDPFQYSRLKNPMDRGAWWVTVHGIAKSCIWLSDRHTKTIFPTIHPSWEKHVILTIPSSACHQRFPGPNPGDQKPIDTIGGCLGDSSLCWSNPILQVPPEHLETPSL